MDYQAIFAVLFIAFLSLFILIKRKNVQFQNILFPVIYFAMYKTKLGLNFMDSAAKRFSKPLKYIGYLGVVIGFVGMVFLGWSLIANLHKLLTIPSAQPGIGIIQPFKANVKGTVYVPFFYFIISVFVIAIVHEFAHGIMARLYNVRVKSSGFAFLGIMLPILPAAFVEPDEERLKREKKRVQLSIFAAGPFANILLAFAILLVSWVIITPFVSSVIEQKGVLVTGLVEKEGYAYPAEKVRISPGEVINRINNLSISTVEDFTEALGKIKPGENISITTNRTGYSLILAANPEDNHKPYIGVYIQQSTRIKDSFNNRYSGLILKILFWFFGLLSWLFVLNLGIGMFNLVPIGPIDGGRMMQVLLQRFFVKEKAEHVWRFVSIIFLLLVVTNFVAVFVK